MFMEEFFMKISIFFSMACLIALSSGQEIVGAAAGAPSIAGALSLLQTIDALEKSAAATAEIKAKAGQKFIARTMDFIAKNHKEGRPKATIRELFNAPLREGGLGYTLASALHRTAEIDSPEADNLLQALLNLDPTPADINSFDKDGWTAPMFLLGKGRLTIRHLQDMINLGLDLALTNKYNGQNLLHFAVIEGNWDGFKFLADTYPHLLTTTTKKGHNVYSLARAGSTIPHTIGITTPIKSDTQRTLEYNAIVGWLWAHHPDIAREGSLKVAQMIENAKKNPTFGESLTLLPQEDAVIYRRIIAQKKKLAAQKKKAASKKPSGPGPVITATGPRSGYIPTGAAAAAATGHSVPVDTAYLAAARPPASTPMAPPPLAVAPRTSMEEALAFQEELIKNMARLAELESKKF
jgi:hypothetical protein